MIRPKLFFDTSMCIDAATGKVPPNEWTRVRKYITRHYRYYISFVTMKELFGRLARCKDEFFQGNKGPLHVLYGTGRRNFLPYPSSFAIRSVLARPVSRQGDTNDLTEEVWAQTIIKAVLRAPSKALLKDGILVPNCKRRKEMFDLDHFDRHEDGAQKEHADLLEGMRRV